MRVEFVSVNSWLHSKYLCNWTPNKPPGRFECSTHRWENRRKLPHHPHKVSRRLHIVIQASQPETLARNTLLQVLAANLFTTAKRDGCRTAGFSGFLLEKKPLVLSFMWNFSYQQKFRLKMFTRETRRMQDETCTPAAWRERSGAYVCTLNACWNSTNPDCRLARRCAWHI